MDLTISRPIQIFALVTPLFFQIVIDKVLTEVGADVRPDQLVVSVAAGVPVEALEGRATIGASLLIP